MTEKQLDKIEQAIVQILECLQIDKDDDNFKNTPSRVARLYNELCEGLYKQHEIECILQTKFPTTYNGIVAQKDINAYSLCPHHLLPVEYKVSIGIIFSKYCIGLSKIPRVIRLLAKRPVLQEQLTDDIVDTFNKYLKLKGIICVVEGRHSCMRVRGVQVDSPTITSAVRGVFLKPESGKSPKEEFLKLIK